MEIESQALIGRRIDYLLRLLPPKPVPLLELIAQLRGAQVFAQVGEALFEGMKRGLDSVGVCQGRKTRPVDGCEVVEYAG